MARRGRLLGPLSARLALAFVSVALGALALLSVLVLIAANRNVSELAAEEHDATVSAIANAATDAYAEADGWPVADLSGAIAIAESAGAAVMVVDSTGRTVASSPGPFPEAEVRRVPVTVSGERVGDVNVGVVTTGLPSAERHIRDALAAQIAAGAGLAALFALVVAIIVSRRITRPVVALIDAVRALEGGKLSVRPEIAAGPGELGELTSAFDRMAATLAREDSLRRALVADIAHELRTPLTVLRATLEAMTDGVHDVSPAALMSMHDDVLRLGRMINDLEALAAADAAGLSLEVCIVDLADVTADALAPLRAQFEAAQVHLDTHLGAAPTHGDPRRLDQVVTNLLTNAVKFNRPGGAVRIETYRDDTGAHLIVADTGIGIRQEELQRVFDRFWRGVEARAVAGSGIGLTVVYELIRAHRGTVVVDSQLGSGTRVTISLPRFTA